MLSHPGFKISNLYSPSPNQAQTSRQIVSNESTNQRLDTREAYLKGHQSTKKKVFVQSIHKAGRKSFSTNSFHQSTQLLSYFPARSQTCWARICWSYHMPAAGRSRWTLDDSLGLGSRGGNTYDNSPTFFASQKMIRNTASSAGDDTYKAF